MKKIIFTLMTYLLLMAGSPVSAQETTTDETSADITSQIESWQKSLDEGGNPLGIRVEGYEEIFTERMQDDISSDSENVSGPRKSAAIFNANAARFFITYMSLDGKKDSIRLSAVIYTRSKGNNYKFDKLLLNCHPTVTSLFEAPSGGNPVDGDIKRIVDDNYMVVCPDYCGYGVSAYKQHPYLIHDVTARNCADAAMAAKEFGKALIGTIPTSFATFIVGYSQGGATALATAKYLESAGCPENYKKELNLSKTVCGDGPYSTVATVKQYIDWGKEGKNLEYPCVLPLIIMAAKEAYGDGCMRTVDMESYFSPEFLATGVFDMLKNKSLTTVDLNKKIKEKMQDHLLPTDVFSDKIIDKNTGDFNTSTNEYKCLMRAMETNELAKGWEPQHPITFFHLKNDGVVPYTNFKAVFDSERKDGIKYKNDGTENSNVSSIDPDVFVDFSYLTLVTSPLSCYYEYVGGLYWKRKVSLEKLNHATGGTYFYILYLFKDDYMR